MSKIEAIPAVERMKERTFELTNRSKSKWVKKGQENMPNPKTLNSPKNIFLPMSSRVWDEASKRWTPTQYIIGANTMYVDDRTVVGEEGKIEVVKGLRSQGYNLKEEEARSKRLNIKFDKGVLFLDRYGADSVLEEFVVTHENNEERPSKKVDPNKFRLFNFAPLRKEEKSKKRLVNIPLEVEAVNMVSKLQTKTPAGGYTYDTHMLNVLLNIFDEGVGLKDEDAAQKMEILWTMAKRDGAAFMQIVNKSFENYRMSVGKAIKFNILELNAKEAKLVIGTKKRAIVEFAGEKDNERTDKLVMHFLGSPSGINDYKEMYGQIEVDMIMANKKS